MSNTTGTAGGVGSSQGGQQGWDDALNTQPIPPSREGTTSAGGTDMGQTKTDKERAEAEAEAGAEPESQLPESVTTKASRGDIESTYVEPEGEPLLTVEEQMAGGSEAQLDERSPAALAEAADERAAAREASVQRSSKAQQSALKGERGTVERTTVERDSKAESKG